MNRAFAFMLCVVVGFAATAQERFSAEVAQIVSRSKAKGYSSPVVFVGSSSIRMWKTLEQDFPELRVLNHGFGGSEFSDLLLYQNQLVANFEPSKVVVYAGDNDIANGEIPDAVSKEAKLFIQNIRTEANDIPIIVLSAKPSIVRWKLKDKYNELNILLQKLAADFDDVHFVDMWNLMLKSNGELDRSLFIEDGLHMNEKGYEIWKNALKPVLSR